MRKFLLPFAVIGIAAGSLVSCKKDAKAPTNQSEISDETLTQIHNLGFYNQGVQKVDEGYLVEGDIILTPQDLAKAPAIYGIRVGNVEQYCTNNLVTVGGGRTITVTLSSRLPSSYWAALDEMISRYNAQGLRITFAKKTSGTADITFVPAHGSYLASSGFPTSTGNPYNQVKVNAQYLGSGNGSTTFTNYIATIFAHEVGHCIGFRHTDYMDRSYSCGGAYSNEGTSTVGANYIANTSVGPEPNSWMLACISANQNRPFDSYDQTALAALYK